VEGGCFRNANRNQLVVKAEHEKARGIGSHTFLGGGPATMTQKKLPAETTAFKQLAEAGIGGDQASWSILRTRKRI